MASNAADREPQPTILNPTPRHPATPPPSNLASRRGALRAALAMAGGAVAVWLSGSQREASARRNACHVRCGGDRRLCRNECRFKGASERQCKRTCTIHRDLCFDRCAFRPLRSRLVRDYAGRES